MPTENLKAYHVGEGSEGEQVVTFASSGAQARREGGNELDLTFEEVSFCRRAPWADEFAGQPFIPAKAYHDQGWWLYCNNCETQLYEDAEDDEGNPLQIVYAGRHAYCDQDCIDSRDKLIADANAKGEAFKAKVLGERPDLTFGEFKIGYPWIVMSATFKFPGCQYGGSVCDQEDSGDLTWYVAQGDKAAWDFYQREHAA
ncbi:hypothetical protein [Pseudomonas fluorescens]|uniref:Uncharacterized protein n=1 Tax=Pseudomonas fluorescens TaxID=294 RepID=A0A0F4TBY8_PSEFL|nr:hypothetical protein [Pseudomonas fluorescens]KJZ41624.1 hypothetical protein VC34_17705 [Pseudomonas fluorescens]